MACVYCHIQKDTNEPFYIGIGKTKTRAYLFGGNRSDWHKRVKKARR